MAKDIYGKGLLSYINGNRNAVFTVESNIAETEQWPVSTFFRGYNEMSQAEKIALLHTKGKILDVGAGAGSHTLWLQQQGKNVAAMDISEGAVKVMRQRGVRQTIHDDFFLYNKQTFDMLLMLMNGIGIVGKLDKLPLFFDQAKKLLNPGGKILIDSSDIIYLFEDDDDGVLIDLNGQYYGELEYQFVFDDEKGKVFNWLFIDFDTLSMYAGESGFSCEKIIEDEHYLYLAELKML